MRDWPGHECGVFYILIIDLILRSVLVVFSLLHGSNYHYKKVPVIVDNLKILTIHRGLFCFICLQSIELRWDINIIFIFIYKIFLKTGRKLPLYIELQWYLYSFHFSDWSIFYHFPYKCRTCDFFVLSVTIFEAVREVHRLCF